MDKVFFFARLILVVVLLLACISCPRFKRNPNLRLLLKEKNYSLLNPRWTRGRWIYYIKSAELPGDIIQYGSGEIWRLKDNGEKNELIFPDTVAIMDISPSETLLVAAYSDLILFNVRTAQTETLAPASPPRHIGLRFGSSDTFIYYSASDGLHRINIYTKDDTAIVSGVIYYFDIYSDSLLFYNQKIVDLATGATVYESPELMKGFFTHSKDSLLLVAERKDGLQVYNTQLVEKFELDAQPYEVSVWAAAGNCIDFNPLNSEQIVFCAARSCEEGFVYSGFELWILEKF